ncbi:methyltransferase domain-containing protein [Nitrospirillum sp. BR 11163]|uniref:methyltransferase domain-containing protein n=1 Tax=Nitrospirillum sp. BR 11163 TaxID=3104323 RepID=UPI002B0009D7|nr:methyltransferase domain-containing protein [Nitrospirillum sp. BR 11163]MEA1676918.1 methyltransferase domain-containing protein [Nitrospirillum sp. BR 11163]
MLVPYLSAIKFAIKQAPILGRVVIERDDLRVAVADAASEVAKLHRHLESVIGECNDLRAEQDRLRATAADAASKVADLQRHLDGVRAERDRLREELGKTAHNLQLPSGEHDGIQRDTSRLMLLKPTFTARNRAEFFDGMTNADFSASDRVEAEVIAQGEVGQVFTRHFCLCCGQTVEMLTDYQYAFEVDGRKIPNWRERVVCPHCGMNNRQRLTAQLVHQHVEQYGCSTLYFMEQVTPIFAWTRSRYPDLTVHGSEYLGFEYVGGTMVNGIRHEDVMDLSFPSDSIDLIVSNDVFEHVPNYRRALAECARVLRPNGHLLATIPFSTHEDQSQVRAEIRDNALNLLLPAQYHGNPLSADGCLVFHDFGWDMLNHFTEAGFASVKCEVYTDAQYGHLGRGQIVFKAAMTGV